MMTEDEMKAFLEENSTAIQERVRERMIEQIAESYRWTMPDTVQNIVSEFITDEVAPVVRKHLQDNKGPIIEGVIKATSGITDKLGETMLEKAVDNMNGYRFGTLMKNIFD